MSLKPASPTLAMPPPLSFSAYAAAAHRGGSGLPMSLIMRQRLHEANAKRMMDKLRTATKRKAFPASVPNSASDGTHTREAAVQETSAKRAKKETTGASAGAGDVVRPSERAD